MKESRFILAVFACLLFVAFDVPRVAQAQGQQALPKESLPMESFGKIPVQHEGRIKPLARFATIQLETLSGNSSDREALPWLAQVLFAPQQAIRAPVIKVGSSALRERFSLPEKDKHLYSLETLAPHLAQTREQAMALSMEEQDGLTAPQKALLHLHENALVYEQLLQTMMLYLPTQIVPPESLGVQAQAFEGHPTFLEIRRKERQLNEKVKAVIAEKGDNPDEYSAQEQALALMSLEYHTLRAAGERNVFFRIVPSPWQDEEEAGKDAQRPSMWYAPWALLKSGQGGPQTASFLGHWQGMAKAYETGDAALWEKASTQAYQKALALSGDDGLSRRLKTENIYHLLSPFKFAFGLYLFALLLAGGYLYTGTMFLRRTALGLTLAGMTVHAAGLAMRIIILERPPVGSLYESLLFVSLVVAGTGFIIEILRRDGISLPGALAAGLGILMIGPVIAPQGDDLEVLVAVLNTNFWLATHVIVITAGYGVCIVTAIFAHIYLFRRMTDPAREPGGLFRYTYLLSLIALFLTAFGTVLGGIWADQSWGRFWGWDPKENGALLIVLWLVWLLHGRAGGQFGALAFNAGLAMLSVVVALSWFGVNLLNVGLHSYGFISGIAWGLGLFCAAEMALTGVLFFGARKRKRKT